MKIFIGSKIGSSTTNSNFFLSVKFTTNQNIRVNKNKISDAATELMNSDHPETRALDSTNYEQTAQIIYFNLA